MRSGLCQIHRSWGIAAILTDMSKEQENLSIFSFILKSFLSRLLHNLPSLQFTLQIWSTLMPHHSSSRPAIQTPCHTLLFPRLDGKKQDCREGKWLHEPITYPEETAPMQTIIP